MPSLHELQRRFAAALHAGDGVQTPMRLAGTRTADRLDIYRRTIATNYRNALGATYPVVRRLVGARFFDASVDAYVAMHPSRSGDLNEYGGTFGDFLAAHPAVSELPYLPDVARLEWRIDEANRAADSNTDPAAVLRALAACPGDQLPSLLLRMDGSCRMIESPFPLLRIWQVNQPGHDGEMRVDFAVGPTDCVSGASVPASRSNACAAATSRGSRRYRRARIWPRRSQRRNRRTRRSTSVAALHRFIGDGTITGILDAPLTGTAARATNGGLFTSNPPRSVPT
jgi:hypothetical protein